MPVAEKAKLADYVIDNAGDRAATERRCGRSTRRCSRDLAARGRSGVNSPTQRRRREGTDTSARARQHFLRDAGLARAIVDLVAPTRATAVIEIGPGEGAPHHRAHAHGRDRSPRSKWIATGHPAPPRRGSSGSRSWTRTRARGTTRRLCDRTATDARRRQPAYSVGKPILEALVSARTRHRRDGADAPARGGGALAAGARAARCTEPLVLTQLYCDGYVSRLRRAAARPSGLHRRVGIPGAVVHRCASCRAARAG
jgi:hypothetical protein